MSDIDQFYLDIADLFTSEWRLDAACINANPAFFYDEDMYAQGRKICDVCPVKVECLDNAIVFNDKFLRGGMDEKERNSIEMHRKRHLASFRYDFSLP